MSVCANLKIQKVKFYGMEIGLMILNAGPKQQNNKFNFKKMMMEYFGCVLKIFTNIL